MNIMFLKYQQNNNFLKNFSGILACSTNLGHCLTFISVDTKHQFIRAETG